MTSIFRSEEGRLRLEARALRLRDRLSHPTERLQVATSWGRTHVLMAGPPDAPPAVLLHGALANSAFLLRELEGMVPRFRVHAVDLVGQSPLSADARPSVSGNDYGRWLAEVLDALGLPSAHLVAVSWGGFVGIRLAAHAPERIRTLALLVPAGVVGSPLSSHLRVGWPMTRYLLRPTPSNLRRFLDRLLTTPDEEWTGYLGEAFRTFNLRTMKVPALARTGELAGFRAPTFVLGAEADLSFPGEPLIRRARQLFPNLVDTELLRGSRHSPPTTPEFRSWMAERLTRFILERDAAGARTPSSVP
jgi:2-hydroxy-6-oxonona-2,4-dienedioate hydrolase